MKCANCGAELKVGCIYCSACGHEAQIVSDYNVLEDDYLKALLEEENEEKKPQKKPQTGAGSKKKKPAKKQKKKIYWFPIVLAIIVVCVIVALVIVMTIRKQRENSFDYQYSQGILAEKNRDYTKAVTYLRRALELDEGNTDVMMMLAEIYEITDDDSLEENMLLQILKLESQNEAAYEMLIALYDSQKKYTKILELNEKLKDTDLTKLFDNYVITSPEFSEKEGTYHEEMTVALTADSGCTIYYTLGDMDPTANGRVYDGPISLKEGETEIRAVAKDERGFYSEMATAKYKIDFVAPNPPTVSPNSGSYTTPQMITVSIPEDSVVYYTWDGTSPTESSARYEGPLEMPEGNNVLALLAVNSHGLSSRVVKFNYIYLSE
jgi:cytochrome c-type biogenesis protein CcmH/NrfG